MAAQHAILPNDIPSSWGPDRLSRKPQRLGLSVKQRHVLEALDTRT
jgi:hypothetical protein